MDSVKNGTKNVMIVVGEAAGQKIQVYVDPCQSSVREEQINTAKADIIEKFTPLGVSENEIEWTENIETR